MQDNFDNSQLSTPEHPPDDSLSFRPRYVSCTECGAVNSSSSDICISCKVALVAEKRQTVNSPSRRRSEEQKLPTRAIIRREEGRKEAREARKKPGSSSTLLFVLFLLAPVFYLLSLRFSLGYIPLLLISILLLFAILKK